MDSLTQAVLGAAVAGAGMGRYHGRRALAYGAALGTLPDLDVFVRYADPVSSMTYHRGFSHSVFLLALLATLITWWVTRRHPHRPYSAWRLYLTIAAALITHPLLDAFTVYGTQLLWPFAVTPQQWSGVFIIDPLYTLPMLLAVIYTLWRGVRPHTRLLAATLAWGCVYLAFGTYGQYHHQQRVAQHLQAQGITVKRTMATPMPFNTLLFRVLAETGEDEYIEAASGWLDRNPPEYIRHRRGHDLEAAVAGHPLYQRLHWLADGWLRLDEQQGWLVVSDLRMGVTGNLTFRFVMAERDAQGQWQHITPRDYGSRADPRPMLARLWPRIWSDTPPLPLEQWGAQQNGAAE
ncbi:inner membrane protein [Neisseria sp. HSC-16F19]|nr:metal-dependent hydrolase [Neisseria sp. HSC-16F19]MCP2040359.1 inner membrane protein [Neisseria sp. HSC-16F19]